jgi:putative oxidoreductase
MSTIAAVIGRILVALLFVASGIMKLLDPGPAADMIRSVGLSPALTIPVALFEIVLGLALALGMATRLASLLLAAFTVLTILFFHNQFADPAQLPTILLHVALVGGLLGIFAHSQIWWSFDALRRRRREDELAHDADERARQAELRAERAEGRAEAHGDRVVTQDGTVVHRRRWFWQ